MNILNAMQATPVRPESSSTNDARSSVASGDLTSGAAFAALLSILQSNGALGSAAAQVQGTASSAALLDRLLNSAGGAPDLAATMSDTADAATRSLAGLLPGAMTRQADALRYGILSEQGADAMRATAPSGRVAPTAAVTDRADLAAVLARIAGTRGLSAEQLAALGDTQGSDVRAALDAVLAQAGTPAGVALAHGQAYAVSAGVAAVSGASRSARDVTTANADVSAVSPVLREKLDRVIARMQQEYGHTVRVAETTRTQERQDYLYAQGRTRPGAVVTWTRDSAHTRGDAVDVTIDGSYTNAEAFARLQRIASEEGLRTLGMQDPGHLQLARAGQTAPSVGATFGARSTASHAVSSAAGVAQVAGVAGVAGIAGFARTAAPARGAVAASTAERNTSAGLPSTPGAVAMASSITSRGDDASRQDARTGEGRNGAGAMMARKGTSRDVARDPLAMATDAQAFGSLASLATSRTDAGVAVTPGAGVLAAARVADVQQLREDAPAGTMSRITLQLDGANGGQDRITVDLRGDTVQTQIRTDAAQADRLRLRTGELQDALGRHGLDGDGVRIAATPRMESGDTMRFAGSDRDGMRLAFAHQSNAGDNGFAQGQRERATTARDWDRSDAQHAAREDREASAQDRDRQRGRRDTNSRSAT